MNNSILRDKVNQLLRTLEAENPSIYELGTPRPVESGEIHQLVALGPQIIPYLLDLLKIEKPGMVAYIALVLGRLGDASAVAPLRELIARYQTKDQKTEWERAAIAQSSMAIAALSKFAQDGAARRGTDPRRPETTDKEKTHA
ncbi:MAG: hypothetical protein ACMG6H_09970 [Acidobacteriota bacterium]